MMFPDPSCWKAKSVMNQRSSNVSYRTTGSPKLFVSQRFPKLAWLMKGVEGERGDPGARALVVDADRGVDGLDVVGRAHVAVGVRWVPGAPVGVVQLVERGVGSRRRGRDARGPGEPVAGAGRRRVPVRAERLLVLGPLPLDRTRLLQRADVEHLAVAVHEEHPRLVRRAMGRWRSERLERRPQSGASAVRQEDRCHEEYGRESDDDPAHGQGDGPFRRLRRPGSPDDLSTIRAAPTRRGREMVRSDHPEMASSDRSAGGTVVTTAQVRRRPWHATGSVTKGSPRAVPAVRFAPPPGAF
jgi:hypothetical protein